MTDPIDIDRLRLSPLFVGLRDDELLALVREGHVAEFGKDTVVVVEGSSGVCVLCSGEVVVQKDAPGEEPVELSVMSDPGAYFGEMVLVDEMPALQRSGPHAIPGFWLFLWECSPVSSSPTGTRITRFS